MHSRLPFRRNLLALIAPPAPAAPDGPGRHRLPTRPVTVFVPQGSGGANDAIARIVLQRVPELLGQSFVIDNRGAPAATSAPPIRPRPSPTATTP